MVTSIIASILLAERLASAGFLLAVILKQASQIRNTVTDYNALRITLMILTAVVFVGQFVPIIFDATVLINEWGSGEAPDGLVIDYTATNATTALLVSVLLYAIYYRRINTRR